MLRLLDHSPPYDRVVVLTTVASLPGARALAADADAQAGAVELRMLDIDDPSDHSTLFEALGPVVAEVSGQVDVLLSAGTPQAQTLWVILVQAGLLRARMLQVIPPAFVPDPHPEPVREVRLDIEGFPEIRALRAEVRRLRVQAEWPIIGEAPALLALRRRLLRIAPSPVPVLVLGETGTGKELVARALHDASDRAEGPFVAANCGALSEGVLASELFGHEAGAFTGATRTHRGLFEQAHGGTLFLDEVGEMPARVQVNLLRVLETGQVRRVGAEQERTVDVRVVAATHRDLQQGSFREDLYYRLRGAQLQVPPLRDRGGDLERLVLHFLAEARSSLTVTPQAWQALRAWSWPGNVRELRAEVLRWTLLCDEEVRATDLQPEIRRLPAATPAGSDTSIPVDSGQQVGLRPRLRSVATSESPRRPNPQTGARKLAFLRSEGPAVTAIRPLAEVVEQVEHAAITEALRATGHNLSQAARALGIDRNTLKRKLRRHAREARSTHE